MSSHVPKTPTRVDRRPKLSVVIPLYNEEDVLPELLERLEDSLGRLPMNAEVVFVDDGSRDATAEIVRAFRTPAFHIRLVQLSRNFGHQAACTAGLAAAEGNAVVLMDGDLQDPPELIGEMIDRWRRGAKVVLARRRSRRERLLRRVLFSLFYRLFGWLTDSPVPLNAGIFSLLDRQVVDALNGMRERSRFLPGLRWYVGFPTAEVLFDRPDRAAGCEKQTFRRLLRYGLDAVFSFSRRPLQLATGLGLLVAGLFGTYGVVLLVLRLLSINVTQGFTTVAVGVFFLGGVQLTTIGILGEYIARIYDEVKGRPLYVVDQVIEVENDPPTATHHEREADSRTARAGDLPLVAPGQATDGPPPAPQVHAGP